MTGIAAVGAYAPRYRIDAGEFEAAWGRFEAAGVERTAVAAADEDALTMGAAATERALAAAGVAGESVAFLALGTTTPPLAEEDLTVRLGAMVDAPAEATHQLFTGSTRAGTRALTAAEDAGPWDDGVALVVASDCPRGAPDDGVEHAAGAGAAALVLSDDAPASVVDRAEHNSPYPGTRFRQSGEDAVEGLGITSYDRQAFRETVGAAADALSVETTADAAAVQAPDGKLPYRAAGALGVDAGTIRECAVVHELGDLGAASVPAALARALADGHERVLGAAYGSGAGADAFVVEAEAPVPADLALGGERDVSYAEYLRLRGELTTGPPSGGGAYVSVPAWRRTLDQRYRLVAGRCPTCGAVAFPPEGACGECGTLEEYESVELPGAGTVEAVTTISRGGAPPEFAEQQAKAGDYAVAVVAFDVPGTTGSGDGGGTPREGEGADSPAGSGRQTDRVSAPAQVTDADPDAVAVGDRVEATVRRIYEQEGVTRYGFKVRPVPGE